jgi:hypothetical protein
MPNNPTLPTWLALNACNFTSPTGLTDLRTGQPVYGGALVLGDYFDIDESQANSLSYTTNGTCHAGRYRFVQVDSGATASNVKTGTIGLMVAGGQPQLNLVTSYDKGIQGAHQVVFLNSITPGNYGFVQELGILTVLCGSSITKSSPNTGDLINATTLGVVDDPTIQEVVPNSIGIALDPPNPATKIRVIASCLPPLQG